MWILRLKQQEPIEQVAKLYFTLGEQLSLDWFMAQIVGLQPDNRWQDLARESYVDDLESQRRRLTASLLAGDIDSIDSSVRRLAGAAAGTHSSLAVHGARFTPRRSTRLRNDFGGTARAVGSGPGIGGCSACGLNAVSAR